MSRSPRVHLHNSSPDTFFVNSFLIEGERSLILVDTQFVLSEARRVCERLTEIGKPLAGIFITHPHPDHYNGLATVLAAFPGTQVYATTSTVAGIKETAEPKRDYWTPIVGADYPQTFVLPEVIITDGQQISLDGIDLIVRDFGPMECSDNITLTLPQIDTVIVSDLVYNRVHPWLAEGRSSKWLHALDDARKLFAKANVLFPGHGAAGGPVILDEQKSYILAFRDLVARTKKLEHALSDAAKASVHAEVKAMHPGLPLEMLIDLNTDSMAMELAE